MRLLTLVLLLLVSPLASAKTLKLATLAPEGSVWHDALQEMAQRWRNLSNGTIEVRIYPGGVAGDDDSMVRKMRIGQLHGAALTTQGMASITPAMRVFQMPMLIRDNGELDYVRDQLADELEAATASAGFELLAWSDVGWVYLFSRDAVTDPDAARKLKLWIAPGDTAWTETLKGAGYRPVVLPTTEILGGLQSGLVDAFNAPPVAALSSQWFGVANHMMDLRWAPLLGAVVISADFWLDVPPDLRPGLQAAARDATAKAKAHVRRFEAEAITAMQQYGLTVHDVSADAAQQFAAEIQASYPKLVGASIPEPIYRTAQAHLDAYRGAR